MNSIQEVMLYIIIFLVGVLVGMTIGYLRMLGYVHKILGIPNCITIKDYMEDREIVKKEKK